MTEEDKAILSKSWVEFVSQIPEMKEWFIQANLWYPEPFHTLKKWLEANWTVEVIGLWQANWLQYWYEYAIIDEVETVIRSKDEDWLDVIIEYPFDIEKYRVWLLNYIEWDNSGNETVNREHTTEEARNKQVNKFGGAINRNLI